MLLMTVAISTVVVRADVAVVPFRLEESRSVDFGDDKVSRQKPAMNLILALNGAEAEACVQYGDVKIEEASDDKGGSLLPHADSFNDPKKFREFSNAFFRKSGFGGRKPAAPQATLALAPAARAATKIARLRGSMTLAQAGTVQSVELSGLKGAAGKAMAIPAEANLTVTATAKDSARSLELEIKGDESALESLEVIDAAGHKISSGMSSWSMNGGPLHRSLSVEKPLDDTMKLVAKVSTNRKFVKVSFDLKDIQLP